MQNSLELRSGQKVSCILYDGNSRIEAMMTYNYLKNSETEKKPIHLGNTNLIMHVTDVEMVQTEDHLKMEMNYKVRVKGVLE